MAWLYNQVDKDEDMDLGIHLMVLLLIHLMVVPAWLMLSGMVLQEQKNNLADTRHQHMPLDTKLLHLLVSLL